MKAMKTKAKARKQSGRASVPLESILEQLLSSKNRTLKARDRFEEALKLGVERPFLEFYLRRIPFLSPTKETIVEGRENRALKKIPRELRAVAAVVDDVNRSPLISPVKVLLPATDQAPGLKPGRAKEFADLPRLLREYADDLEARLRLIPVVRQHKAIFSDLEAAKFLLLTHFEQRTGEPRFALIADLLWASFEAAGTPPSKVVDADSLRKLWRRNPLRQCIVLLSLAPAEKSVSDLSRS
jgi:hypothetical protein